eukprot:CAMPEP_0197696454 /NCGR_PEP_ID=MMETSP1338-20131121/116640_1 /TAXON_ID=43686 ORGANISM="Pelagodinium beii, Strain RCC1491" /NCGR_SAMPLE_ID=MMETSP1338 /ASSEMBLY_ACC=CAM_ASM_000754 /LENGTH=288 /DNA_ID=CAMNT_0043279571 /DNA_START=21 /DNA_END=884 /DNA_ORIENTATION=-
MRQAEPGSKPSLLRSLSRPSDPEQLPAWAGRVRERLGVLEAQMRRLEREKQLLLGHLFGTPADVLEEILSEPSRSSGSRPSQSSGGARQTSSLWAAAQGLPTEQLVTSCDGRALHPSLAPSRPEAAPGPNPANESKLSRVSLGSTANERLGKPNAATTTQTPATHALSTTHTSFRATASATFNSSTATEAQRVLAAAPTAAFAAWGAAAAAMSAAWGVAPEQPKDLSRAAKKASNSPERDAAEDLAQSSLAATPSPVRARATPPSSPGLARAEEDQPGTAATACDESE